MKRLLTEYARYNLWAHQRLMECILRLPGEKYHEEIDSSFNSFYKTVAHVWVSEKTWLNRVQGIKIKIEGDPFSRSFEAAANALLETDQEWLNWMDQLKEESMQIVFDYQNMKGDPFSQPYYQVYQHVFNHGTYHNGQLVTMLHQAGVKDIPPTDFIVWSR
jgi:uncharacterized damage-inducible protein DinB